MKKDKLTKNLTYKEAIDRYDVEFIYKNKIRLLFMLPSSEKEYAEALMEDTTIRAIMKLYYFFYFIYRKDIFNWKARELGADILLEDKGITHDGEIILEAI